MTLAEDLYAYLKSGKPIPVASIKGLIFTLLLPRMIVIVGSLIGAVLVATQTYLLFLQYKVLETQNGFLSRQTALEVFDKTSRFRDILYLKQLPGKNREGEVAWPAPSRSAVVQIAQFATIDPTATIPALQALLKDDAGSVSAGALRVIENLRRNGIAAAPDGIGNFGGSSLEGVNLDNGVFGNSNFRYADLSHAAMQSSKFGGASFSRANLIGANLSNSSLIDATLDCSNLRDATLTSTDVARASFKGADLRNVDLQELKNWDQIEDLRNANIDGVRNSPKGFINWAINKGAVIREEKNGLGWSGDAYCDPRY